MLAINPGFPGLTLQRRQEPGSRGCGISRSHPGPRHPSVCRNRVCCGARRSTSGERRARCSPAADSLRVTGCAQAGLLHWRYTASYMPQIAVPKDPFDAIVVGSGATGGWAAKKLTESGMRVVMLEAGKKIT